MITYQLLPESIIIIYDGLPYTISCDDPRYEKVKNNLNDLKPEHFTLYNELPKGFKEVNGALFFHKFQIPAKVEMLLFESKYKNSFCNFWANITARLEFKDVCKVVKQMEQGILRPISNDGFIVSSTSDKNFLTDEFVVCNYKTESIEETCLESYPKEFFSKREFVNEVKILIRSGAKLKYIKNLGKMTFGSTLDETVGFFKSKLLMEHQEILHSKTVSLVKNFLKNKTNTFSKDRFLNLINHPDFLDLVSMHNFCVDELITFDLQDASMEQALFIVRREYMRLNRKGLGLNIIHNFPHTEKLDGLKLDENYKLIVPKTDKELVGWGSSLGNCVGNGSYARKCKERTCYILGLYYDNKIMASIEINSKQDKVVQFEGRFGFGQKNHLDRGSGLWTKVQQAISESKIVKEPKVS